jgi:hypothetical protein
MRKLSSLLLIALVAVPIKLDAQEEPLPYRVNGGRVVIHFNQDNLAAAGLEITDLVNNFLQGWSCKFEIESRTGEAGLRGKQAIDID